MKCRKVPHKKDLTARMTDGMPQGLGKDQIAALYP